MKTLLISIAALTLTTICRAELREIAVEVSLTTNSQVVASIYSDQLKEQRKNSPIGDVVQVLQNDIVYAGSSVWIVMVIRDYVPFRETMPIINAIAENKILELIDLRTTRGRDDADQILKGYGVEQGVAGYGAQSAPSPEP